MSKKGQEQIITTILLILIVLAAIIIVWQVIDRFIKGGSAEISSRMSCIDVRLDIVSAVNSSQQVKVTRLVGGDNDAVSDLKILVNGAVATIGTAPSPTALEPLETKTWTLSTPFSVGNEIQVAPVLKDGTICDVSDTEIAVAA